MELGLSGLASNFDWKSFIDQMSEVERLPQRRLLAEQNTLEERNNAYGSLVTQVKVLKTRVEALKNASLYDTRAATTGDATVATVSAGSGAIQGSFQFSFSQLATTARVVGTSGVGKALAPTSDVSTLKLSDAGFASPVTAGTFRVNNAEVSIATSDTLADVFSKISTATSGTVTGRYDAAADKIVLEGTGTVVLGSATDTSNFLQVARLHNNGTGTVTSTAALGSARQTATLDTANLATPLSFGTGTGKFKVNGVEFEYTASDTLADVMKRINTSTAGVNVSYDAVNDRFTAQNKNTGDVGIAFQDVTGNFLASTGLSSGTLERGKDLLYTINGGGQLRSNSNTIREASSGLSGITVTALKEGGSTLVNVTSDTTKVREAITGFIDEYNRAQSFIANRTASTTDADGKVKTSVLTSDSDVESVASTLRRLSTATLTGLDDAVVRLESLGIKSNGDDDKLSLADSAKLDSALADNLAGVEKFFTDATGGFATKLDEYLEKLAGEEGTLLAKQDLLTRQASDIDTQVADLERIVQANRSSMESTFIAMETAQAKINQQLQYLLQNFGNS